KKLDENPAQDKLALRPLSREDIVRGIAKLKTNKAAGLDGITNKMLKTAKNFVATKLLPLFNTVIQNGEFIEEWKEAKIRAIFKNTGSEQEPANYRPISLLSCVSKLFERCIHPQIYQALEPFLPNCQHAFRKRHSITTALAEICEKILLNMENNNLTYIVQLDV
ncbi:putative RNA-directed DNA polymerase from transposon X-element, partial [Toxocara canis]